MAEFLS